MEGIPVIFFLTNEHAAFVQNFRELYKHDCLTARVDHPIRLVDDLGASQVAHSIFYCKMATLPS